MIGIVKVIYAIFFIVALLGGINNIGKERSPITAHGIIFNIIIFMPLIIILITN